MGYCSYGTTWRISSRHGPAAYFSSKTLIICATLLILHNQIQEAWSMSCYACDQCDQVDNGTAVIQGTVPLTSSHLPREACTACYTFKGTSSGKPFTTRSCLTKTDEDQGVFGEDTAESGCSELSEQLSLSGDVCAVCDDGDLCNGRDASELKSTAAHSALSATTIIATLISTLTSIVLMTL